MTKGSYPNCYILISLCIICLSLTGCGRDVSESVAPPLTATLETRTNSQTVNTQDTNTQATGTQATNTQTNTQATNTQLVAGQPQFLPIEGRARLAGRTVELEVARTPAQKAKGMMWRRDPLPENRGMVFPFPQPQFLAFWMKNCFVPLDMVFIHRGEVVAIETANPCLAEPCPIYPREPVFGDTVIELRAGWAKAYGLKVGDRVEVTID